MQPHTFQHRLNQISTQWSLVYRAHQGSTEAANSARQQLLERYGGAVRRYLRKVLHDPDAVDEVFQEFALHLIRGDLRGATPQRGRFRNFMKGTLFHLIASFHRRRRRWPEQLRDEDSALAINPEEADCDHHFQESWRDELLARAWAALANLEERTGQPLYAVLRFRADHPEMRSPQMAAQLAAQLCKPFTAASVRQNLHRARQKFAAFLLLEVTESVGCPTSELLEQELVELGLLDYCRPALGRQLQTK
jgi:RNA polymerase sigma factor (sigma-70 family)